MNKRSETELVQEAQNGNLQAFEELVERYRDLIFRQCARRTHNPEDAEDLAQETFLRAWVGLNGLRVPERFYPWLRRIAANACNGYLRWLREAPLDVFAMEEWLAATDVNFVPLNILESLPESARRILTDVYLDGLSYEELARIYGCTITAVKGRLHRARSSLREELDNMADKEGFRNHTRPNFTKRVLERIEALRAGDAAKRRKGARDLRIALEPSRIDKLLRYLGNEYDGERSACAKALGRIRLPRVRDALIERLKVEPCKEVRLNLAIALGNQRDPAALPALEKAAKDKNGAVRWAANEAIRLINQVGKDFPSFAEEDALRLDITTAASDPGQRRILLKELSATLDDPDPHVRGQAAKALGGLGDKRVVRRLSKLVDDPDSGVACAALTAIGQIGGKAAPPAIIKGLERSGLIRDAAYHAVSEKMKDPDLARAILRAIAASAKEPNSRGVVFGWWAAEHVLTPELLSEAKEAINAAMSRFPKTMLTEGYVRCVAKVGDNRHVEELLRYLREGVEKAEVALGLGRIGDPKAIPDLEAMLFTSEDEPDRGAAAYGLAGFGESGLEILRRALQHPNTSIREAAVNAFAFLVTDPKALPILERLRASDPVGSIRLHAGVAIRQVRRCYRIGRFGLFDVEAHSPG